MSKLEFEKYWEGNPLLEKMINEYESEHFWGDTFESFINAFYNKLVGHFYYYNGEKWVIKC